MFKRINYDHPVQISTYVVEYGKSWKHGEEILHRVSLIALPEELREAILSKEQSSNTWKKIPNSWIWINVDGNYCDLEDSRGVDRVVVVERYKSTFETFTSRVGFRKTYRLLFGRDPYQ